MFSTLTPDFARREGFWTGKDGSFAALRMTKGRSGGQGGTQDDKRALRMTCVSPVILRRSSLVILRPEAEGSVPSSAPHPALGAAFPLGGKVLEQPRSESWDRGITEGRGRPGGKTGVQLRAAGRCSVRRDADGKRIHQQLRPVPVAGLGQVFTGGVQPGQRKNRRRAEGGGREGRPGPQRPGDGRLQHL